MNPPTLASWNLALRFGLELGALEGLGLAAWKYSAGPLRWVAVIAIPISAAVIWGIFNVLDDPSRSTRHCDFKPFGAVNERIERYEPNQHMTIDFYEHSNSPSPTPPPTSTSLPNTTAPR